MLSWGNNPSGCLGHSHNEPRSALPRPVLLPRRHVVVGVAAGSSHTLMLTDQGIVLGVGSGGNGELGVGDRKGRSEPTVMPVPGAEVVRIAAGAHFSCVSSAVGKVFTCGINASGQLGLGHRRPALKPTQVRIFGVDRPRDDGDEGGEAAGEGEDSGGAGAAAAKAAASRAKDTQAVEVAVGLSHTLILTAGGIVYAFGSMINGTTSGSTVVR